MNPHLKLRVTLVIIGIFKIIQMILQLCTLTFSISVESDFKHNFEVNLMFLVLNMLSIAIDFTSYKKNHSFLYGEIIFSLVALLGYIPFVIFLSAATQLQNKERKLSTLEDQLTKRNSNEPLIINMDSKFSDNNDLYLKIVLPIFFILMIQIVNFILSLIIVDVKDIIRRINVLNANRIRNVVRDSNISVNRNRSNLNNAIQTSIIVSEPKIIDPPPPYNEVINQIPTPVASVTPPPTYSEAKLMLKTNLHKDISYIEEETEKS